VFLKIPKKINSHRNIHLIFKTGLNRLILRSLMLRIVLLNLILKGFLMHWPMLLEESCLLRLANKVPTIAIDKIVLY
jgi:hypothetical protein